MDINYVSPVEKKRKRKNSWIAVTFVIFLFASFVVSMNTGYIRLTPLEVVQTIIGNGSAKQELILFTIRLPRIIIAILVGAALAVSGCILQGMTRNALADPGILGINAGAGLVVMLFVAFMPTQNFNTVVMLPIAACLGAALTAFLIYTLSYNKEKGFSPKKLLLTGIALASGISAVTIILTLRLSPEQYQFIAIWMAGGIWGASWNFVLALLPFIVLLIPYVWRKSHVLNILNLGDALATGLGATIKKDRFILLAIAVILAGSAVSVSGGIGFVGLIAPHLVRRLVGPKHQVVIPISALVGGFFVLVADTIGRWLIQPSEIPAGIVVAVIGAPYFLYLLARTKVSS
ncbi:FecCD family ABC transporter permease [Priestia taiwanensis]|uniref:Iron ABC transporter permease n=1 Tax=Priestia taiwanensis TaxID=1347902 RepID=A0A917EPH8_9BACI|nr:iron ABC transporter permease [Priestia taiwanensis]MBM7363220.1 iron complex transport system permease protein [Priestia taiwanensis]GGE68640.1 iron ABC transporter permease [Priestia taiwanensis]